MAVAGWLTWIVLCVGVNPFYQFQFIRTPPSLWRTAAIVTPILLLMIVARWIRLYEEWTFEQTHIVGRSHCICMETNTRTRGGTNAALYQRLAYQVSARVPAVPAEVNFATEFRGNEKRTIHERSAPRTADDRDVVTVCLRVDRCECACALH